jgi:hypothetical protein
LRLAPRFDAPSSTQRVQRLMSVELRVSTCIAAATTHPRSFSPSSFLLLSPLLPPLPPPACRPSQPSWKWWS